MQKYDFLIDKKIFNLDDINNEVNNISTAKSMIQRFLKSNKITRIKQNLYCFNNNIPNRYEVASQINKDAYLSYHSALEYHSVNNQEFFDIYVSSKNKFNTFEFEGINYIRVNSRGDEGVITSKENKLVRATDLERTIVDCIDRIDLCGGLEELIKYLRNVMVLNTNKMVEYLRIYDKNVLYLKVGYIFSNFVQEVDTKYLIDECEKYKTNKKYYVETNKERYSIVSKEWNLILPEEIQQYI